MFRSTRAAAPPKSVAFHQHSCWTAPLQINLALENEQFTIQQRCGIRYSALADAKAACEKSAACGGITEDGGLRCGDTHLNFELRVKREVKGSSSIRASWIKLQPTAGQPCTQQRESAVKQFVGKATTPTRRGPIKASELAQPKRKDTWVPAIAPAVALQLGSHTSGMPVSSSRHCVGRCCSTPLQRNRTCAFRDLLFIGSPSGVISSRAIGSSGGLAPRRFYYLSDDPKVSSDDHATFLHNRFSGGDTTGRNSRSYFAPGIAPTSAARDVTKVIQTPVYIGADVHSNIAHLMLDSVFPSIISLLLLQASIGGGNGAGDSSTAAASAGWPLPNAINGNFTFLLYDPPQCCPGWHRDKKERAWTSQLAGSSVVDLDELSQLCPPPGCLVRTSWVGAGHLGLCAVDEHNVMGGARHHRSLFRFRQRIFHKWGVPHTPLPLPSSASSMQQIPAGAGPTVLVVQTKRTIHNIADFVKAINTAPNLHATAKLIKWETMSFVEQLREMRGAAVQASGVGSAQINQFLMPRGSVAVCLGWRDDRAQTGIHYFDHHVLRSLDHVRAVYYPSYSRSERPSIGGVRLNLTKAVEVIRQALSIYTTGYEVPIQHNVNVNDYDKIFNALVKATDYDALRFRTDDFEWAKGVQKGCSLMNGVEQMLWGTEPSQSRATTKCPWYWPVPGLLRKYPV